MSRWILAGLVPLVTVQACARTPPAPSGTAADSAAAAGIRAVMAVAPATTRYCLALENPAFDRDPRGRASRFLAPSARLLALVAAGRPASAPPVVDRATCGPRPDSGAARLIISAVLPAGDSAARVTAAVGYTAGLGLGVGYGYECPVQRTRSGWTATDRCQLTSIGN